MTRSLSLGPDLRQSILETVREQAQAIAMAARRGAVAADQFVFFAAFDGTNNDLTTDGHGQNTNVAQLFLQAQAAQTRNPNLSASYYPGPGTKGTLSKSDWLNSQVTKQVAMTAGNAYDDFARGASAWLDSHPGGAVTAVLTSFSRGIASAAIFTQLLNQKGVVDFAAGGKVQLAPGQVKVSAGVLFDPVATGVTVSIAFAPNVSNIVNIRAQDDYRQLFKAVDYSKQAAVTTVAMIGNHCDIGGGYDNGIAALTLQAATDFFRNSGVDIGPVSKDRQFAGVDSIAVHTEEVDDNNKPKWDVYGLGFRSTVIKDPSPRLCDTNILIASS